ncbi:response regulator [Fusobacterium mortiferum]|uniref:Response regulator n=1 Tax=Fusobacterium mortiferum TaxID=850 RepID=A0ABS2G0K5_FUSMR|nr:response regulator [Fusobacterium mortiferum]MBM6874315.1 response regulator [Fusobacterium mortiferum]
MEKKNTLLIVDDLEMNRAILSNIFKKKYEIVEVASGIEALEYIRENSNKIVSILLDLVMPEMNGIEVLKMMKNY